MQDKVCERFVRRYLLSKNFKDTLNAFETECSREKNRGKFQPLDVVDQLQEAMYDSNLTQLISQWNFLENTLFHRLSSDKQLAANELKVHVFRTYLVQAKIKKRQAKMTEFFELLSSHFSFGKEEWKSWCALPYAVDPKMHSEFFMYFTKSWMDVLILSLTNFLCLVNYSESNESRIFFETELPSRRNKSNSSEKISTSGNQLPFGEFLDDFNELGTIRTHSKLT
ncbi:Lissencephaly type-1-like homology motif [Schistosoma japonicum]|uniref:Lissencephaly type-1-like homology motif,domain-containing protein n=2 Tax=Schistosoma japonicum TaxID=6182 RepID=C1L7X7_SCHJA|nr:Lissencephaly type-1-like homology motif [Schistosoma japonicum]KAH8872072.1 Lissencephaly type-1-like homology motif [Schistosoma japonicum]CAX70804.1 Lissencephaly type-1-like homology motif,domain-containing protein [Schistosoma japonicum]CAX70805.1 Lissencephaly type-1-like homology motif,domain-containing protein [Schistosoma japonicum]